MMYLRTIVDVYTVKHKYINFSSLKCDKFFVDEQVKQTDKA